jgi:hypothetical protein
MVEKNCYGAMTANAVIDMSCDGKTRKAVAATSDPVRDASDIPYPAAATRRTGGDTRD